MLALAPDLQAAPLPAIGAVIPDPELAAHCLQGMRKAGLGTTPAALPAR
jgi:hypothetical protein